MKQTQTLLDWARHWAHEARDVTHFVQPQRGGPIQTWSFGEAWNEARRMATFIDGLGLPRGSRIAIWSKNCAHWILADWAIWMAGHVSVPLYPALDAGTARYVLEHSDAKLVFVGALDPSYPELQQGVLRGVRRVSFPQVSSSQADHWDDIVTRCGPAERIAEPSFEELATILYTSGSTGLPKGVMLSFGAMAAAAEGFVNQRSAAKRQRKEGGAPEHGARPSAHRGFGLGAAVR